jgi:hypothetical protein
MVAMAVSVLIGAATWTSSPETGERFGVVVLAILSVSILQQGFSGGVAVAGHLWDLLSDSLSPRMVLVLTSVVFGLLHIVSGSGATSIGETAVHRQCHGAHVRLWSGQGEDRSSVDGGWCPLRCPHRAPKPSDRAEQLCSLACRAHRRLVACRPADLGSLMVRRCTAGTARPQRGRESMRSVRTTWSGGSALSAGEQRRRSRYEAAAAVASFMQPVRVRAFVAGSPPGTSRSRSSRCWSNPARHD